jgi:hypothetical protein
MACDLQLVQNAQKPRIFINFVAGYSLACDVAAIYNRENWGTFQALGNHSPVPVLLEPSARTIHLVALILSCIMIR